MKTFEQCCDEVAKKHGYEDLPLTLRFCQEAAELYASEVAREKDEEIEELKYDVSSAKSGMELYKKEAQEAIDHAKQFRKDLEELQSLVSFKIQEASKVNLPMTI